MDTLKILIELHARVYALEKLIVNDSNLLKFQNLVIEARTDAPEFRIFKK